MLEILYQNEETREVIYRKIGSGSDDLIHTLFETWPEDLMPACEREYQRVKDPAAVAGDQKTSEEL